MSRIDVCSLMQTQAAHPVLLDYAQNLSSAALCRFSMLFLLNIYSSCLGSGLWYKTDLSTNRFDHRRDHRTTITTWWVGDKKATTWIHWKQDRVSTSRDIHTRSYEIMWVDWVWQVRSRYDNEVTKWTVKCQVSDVAKELAAAIARKDHGPSLPVGSGWQQLPSLLPPI